MIKYIDSYLYGYIFMTDRTRWLRVFVERLLTGFETGAIRFFLPREGNVPTEPITLRGESIANAVTVTQERPGKRKARIAH